MLIIHFQEGIDGMNMIGCAKAEEGLKTTPNSECALNALAIDNPLEYARLYLVELCRYGLIRRIH